MRFGKVPNQVFICSSHNKVIDRGLQNYIYIKKRNIYRITKAIAF